MITDVESLVESMRTYLKTNLNTKIVSINAAKLVEDSTTFSIDKIGGLVDGVVTANDETYLTEVNMEDLPNRTFLIIGLNGPFDVETNGNDYYIDVSVDIEIVFQRQHNEKVKAGYVAFRYMKALLETMINYEASADEVEGLTITSGIPMEVNAKSRRLITGGITVSVRLA